MNYTDPALKIKNFLESPFIYRRALILNDKWGTGKTTLVNALMKGNIHDVEKISETYIESYYFLNLSEYKNKNNIRRNLIFFSKLINKEDETFKVTEEQFRNINFIKKGARALIDCFKDNSSNNYKYLNLADDILNLISKNDNIIFNNKKLNKKVLIVDELERMPDIEQVKELLFFLIELQEKNEIRVIIVLNEDELNIEIKEIFQKWKDKISSVEINMKGYNKPKIKTREYSDIYDLEKNYNIEENNIRVLENLSIIQKIIEEEIKKEKIIENKHQKKLVDELMNEIHNELNDYISSNSKNNNSQGVYSLGNLEIKDILNMNYSSIFNRLSNIKKYYNNQNKELLNIFRKIEVFVGSELNEGNRKLNEEYKSKYFGLLEELCSNKFFIDHMDINYAVEHDLNRNYDILIYINYLLKNFTLNEFDVNKVANLILLFFKKSYEKNVKEMKRSNKKLFSKKLTTIDESVYYQWFEYLRYIKLLDNFSRKFKCYKSKNLSITDKYIKKIMKKMYLILINDDETSINKDETSKRYLFHIMYNDNIINILKKEKIKLLENIINKENENNEDRATKVRGCIYKFESTSEKDIKNIKNSLTNKKRVDRLLAKKNFYEKLKKWYNKFYIKNKIEFNCWNNEKIKLTLINETNNLEKHGVIESLYILPVHGDYILCNNDNGRYSFMEGLAEKIDVNEAILDDRNSIKTVSMKKIGVLKIENITNNKKEYKDIYLSHDFEWLTDKENKFIRINDLLLDGYPDFPKIYKDILKMAKNK